MIVDIMEDTEPDEDRKQMQFLHIVVGSVTGTALKTARYIRDGLPEQFAVQLHEYPDLDDIVKEPEQTILFCVSNLADYFGF